MEIEPASNAGIIIEWQQTALAENRTFPVEVNIPSRPVGISYVTVQIFGDIYPPQKALNVGTVFAALDYPFTSTCCFSKRMKGGAYE